jgi:N-acetylneuraminic acid mutarotase
LNTLEAYDPSTDTWTTKAPMPTARSGLSASVIGGKLYAVGGNSQYPYTVFNKVEAYDPATDAWTTEPSMPTARTGLATGVVGGRLFAIGGYYNYFRHKVEAFNPRKSP